MFSFTKVERFCAVRTKSTITPSNTSTNVVLMVAVMNCVLRNECLFLLMDFYAF